MGIIGTPAGACSIFDGEFADESFEVKHTEPGLIGMCKRNGIANTNECQFYVTLSGPLPFLDGETVVFGRVVNGFRVFRQIEKLDTTNEYPIPQVVIQDSGLYKIDDKKLSSKK